MEITIDGTKLTDQQAENVVLALDSHRAYLVRPGALGEDEWGERMRKGRLAVLEEIRALIAGGREADKKEAWLLDEARSG